MWLAKPPNNSILLTVTAQMQQLTGSGRRLLWGSAHGGASDSGRLLRSHGSSDQHPHHREVPVRWVSPCGGDCQ